MTMTTNEHGPSADACGVPFAFPEREPIAITGSAPKNVRIVIADQNGGWRAELFEAFINWLRKHAD